MPRTNLWLLLIIVVTFGVYAPSLLNDFTYDDAEVVRVPTIPSGNPNRFVAELQPLSVYFSTGYGESHDAYGRGFRPVTVLSFALVHSWTKSANPPPMGPVAPAWPQHLVNILLHCLGVWLTFRMIALFLGAGWPALTGAAVFGLHALRSDPVISMVGRGEIMGYVFGATTLLFVVKALRCTGGDRIWRLFVAGLTMFLAVGSKESVAPWIVFIPLVVLALRWADVRAGNQRLPGLGLWMSALVVPFAIFLIMLFKVWGGLGEEFEPAYDNNPVWYESGFLRLVNGVIILGYGLYKVCLPIHLAHDYSAVVFKMAESAADHRFLVASATLLAVLVAGVLVAKRHPLLFLAVSMFFGFSFLTSNIPFPVETVFGERLYYTPAAGLSLLVAWISSCMEKSQGKQILAVVVGIWVLVCSGLIVKRDFDWRNNQTLFGTDLEKQPDCIRTHMALMQHLRRGDPRIWKAAIDRAHAIDPGNPAPLQELAYFFNRAQQPIEAEKLARQALATSHIDLRDHLEQLNLELAVALGAQGRFPDAERTFREILAAAAKENRPANGRVFLEFGDMYLRNRQPEQAKRIVRELTRLDPRNVLAWERLLFLAQAERNDKEVEALLQAAGRHCPPVPPLFLHQAMLLFRRGDRRQAAQLFDEWIRRIPPILETADYFEFYAFLLADQRRIDEARQLVANFLRMPFLRPEKLARFRMLAQQLGMIPK